jgi:hypothetical protein
LIRKGLFLLIEEGGIILKRVLILTVLLSIAALSANLDGLDIQAVAEKMQ